MELIDSEQVINIDITPLHHESLHDDIVGIVRDKLRSGIANSRQEWQDFLCSAVGRYDRFIVRQIDQSARLIEMITLDAVTAYMNDINKGNLKYAPAFLPRQSDPRLIPYIGKDSCDGVMVEASGRHPEIVFMEQKSSMRNPSDSGIGDINDYFEDWIENLLKDMNGNRLLWVFNVMPYSDESEESRSPFDIDRAIDLVHSKKSKFYAGVICLYTHPDESTLEIICAPIREANKSHYKDANEIKRIRYSI